MLNSESIRLRMYMNEEDVLEVNRIYNDLDERSEMDHTEIYSPIGRLKAFRETGLWTQNEGSLLITDNDEKIIGTISYSRKSEFELSLGYRIFQRENRKKGYMAEALLLFSSYLFKTIPHITRLSLFTAEDNVGSRKLAEKCGFTKEGVLRDAYFYRGSICNWVIYSILRDECVKQRSSLEN